LCAAGILSNAFGELSVKPSAAVQLSKNAPSASAGNLDDAFVRGEVTLSGEDDKGWGGMLHLRFEVDFGPSTVATTVRQGYYKIPVSILTILGGRWYEIYAPGAYFGRYLFGVSSAGSGAMKTNYTVVDGLRLKLDILKDFKTSLNLAFLGEDLNLHNAHAMALLSSAPIDMLTFNLGSTIHTLMPEGADRVDRFVATAQVKIVEDLTVFAEYGLTNVAEAADNSWILWGVQVPAWKILDMLQFEFEYKKDRLGTGTDGDLAWMVVMEKKIMALAANLNIGADPKGLASTGPGDVGVYLRTTMKF
jgi:hypothetical protein